MSAAVELPLHYRPTSMDAIRITRDILRSTLQLGDRADELATDTPLMGALPEINSLTIVGIVTAIEDRLGVTVSDREISSEIFESFGSLARFVRTKSA